MRTLNTKFLEFEVTQDSEGFWFSVENGMGTYTADKLERQELVQLKTMIEETLNGSNTTNQ